MVRGASHPLGWLPTYLLPIEENLPSYAPVVTPGRSPFFRTVRTPKRIRARAHLVV